MVLEAFGSVDISPGDWTLTRDGNFDLLILRNDRGVILQKVYIETCDYVVRKIERFDDSGDIYLKAEFVEYERVVEGFLTPSRIKIAAVSEEGSEDSVEITLSSVKPTELSGQQRQRLFVRPLPRGFNHIYQVIDGKAVEQKQQ
jgi:hypothetical protein